MTVRFSDIIGKDEKKEKENDTVAPEERQGEPPAAPERGPEAERMSNSQILRTDEIGDIPDPFSTDRYSEKIRSTYQALLERAREVRDRVKANQGVGHSPILSLLHEIVAEDLIDPLYEYAISVPDGKGLPSHCVCVTLAAMKVGRGLGYDTKKLLRLGLAAFLENVGMYKIPEHILEKKEKLTQEELDTIRNHPQISAQILAQMGDAFQWLAQVASQVHERADGSGYPNGLRGNQITEAASIIGLVDTYVAMIKKRPYRDKIMESEAVKFLVELGKGKFPRKVVKEFLNQISLFPINTYVRLNNQSIGRVIHTDKAQPLRPTIELLYDGLGQRLEKGEVIHLAATPLLHIVDTIDDKELR